MRVVVIGGGIVGVTSAVFLQRDSETVEEVIICERDNIGAGSTERAVGGIRAQFSTDKNIRMSRFALDYWRALEETQGTDIGFKQGGYLFLAESEGGLEDLKEQVEKQNSHGVDSELVHSEHLSKYLDGVQTERYAGGSYCPTDARADPHLALQAMSRIARDVGVDIRTGCEVMDIDLNGIDVSVETSEGRIRCDYVVNAAGPWAANVNTMAGVDLPVTPQRRQVAVVEPEQTMSSDAPLTADLNSGVYFLPDTGNDVLVGGYFDEEEEYSLGQGYPRKFDNRWAMEALEHAEDVATYFGPETKIKNGWSGLYAVTPDHNPIIEETRPGYVNAVGFSGHGFMHAPATGRLVRAIVEDEDPAFVDRSAFRSDRLDKEEKYSEKNVI